MDIDRRGFIKGALAAMGFVSAAVALGCAAKKAETAEVDGMPSTDSREGYYPVAVKCSTRSGECDYTYRIVGRDRGGSSVLSEEYNVLGDRGSVVDTLLPFSSKVEAMVAFEEVAKTFNDYNVTYVYHHEPSKGNQLTLTAGIYGRFFKGLYHAV